MITKFKVYGAIAVLTCIGAVSVSMLQATNSAQATKALQARAIVLLNREYQLDSLTQTEFSALKAGTHKGVLDPALAKAIETESRSIFVAGEASRKSSQLQTELLSALTAKPNLVSEPTFAAHNWKSFSVNGNQAFVVVRGSFTEVVDGKQRSTANATIHLSLKRTSSKAPWLIANETWSSYNPS